MPIFRGYIKRVKETFEELEIFAQDILGYMVKGGDQEVAKIVLTDYDNLDGLTVSAAITKALSKAQRLGYIEKVSKFRSHPKWRHVMGTVWRIVYDDRLDPQALIDSMDRDDPPPIVEADLPQTEAVTDSSPSNHEQSGEADELVWAEREARWYVGRVSEMTGEVRLINERSIHAASLVIQAGLVGDKLRDRVAVHLQDCRANRRSAPHHLGFLIA